MIRQRTYAVITGASSGIGLEYAKAFANLGISVLLVARREERLKKIAKALHDRYGTVVDYYAADLSNPGELAGFCRKLRSLPIRYFLNNAGFGECGALDETSFRRDLTMIDTNVRAVHVLTKFMIRYYEKHKIPGYLLNTASSAGLLPGGPYMSTYYATKSYVVSLTLAAAEELREKGSEIYVGCLCPGPVDTEFNRVAGVRFSLKGISAKECVRKALEGMQRRKVIIVPERTIQAAVFGARFLPREVTVRITASQQHKKLYGRSPRGKRRNK